MKRTILVGTVCALLGGAAVAVAGGNDATPAPPGSMPHLATHTLKGPSGKLAARRPAPFRSVLYKETSAFAVPANGRRGATITCPRRSVAASGYWRTDGGIASDFSAIKPRSGRKWQLDLFDTTGVQGTAAIGVVCLKY
jgi:hypothetical protein